MRRRRWHSVALGTAVVLLGTTACAGSSGAVAASPRGQATQPARTLAPAAARPTGWQPLGEPGVGGRLTALAVDPGDSRHLLAGGDLTGISVSTDRGTTWRAGRGLPSYEIASFTFNARQRQLWAATMSGPMLSRDGGVSWRPARGGMPQPSAGSYSVPIQSVLVDPADARHLMALSGSRRGWSSPGRPDWGSIWTSTDAGTSWIRRTALPQGIDGAVWPSASKAYAVAGDAGLWTTGDGGRSWSRIGQGSLPGSRLEDVAAVGSDLLVTVTSHDAQPGGVWRSTDGGRSWAPSGQGLATVSGDSGRASSSSVLGVSGGTAYVTDVGYASSGVFVSSDRGASWERSLGGAGPQRPYGSGLSGRALAVDPRDPDHVLVGTDDALLQTDDGGVTWRDVASSAAGDGYRGTGPTGLVVRSLAVLPGGGIALAGMDGANPLLQRGAGWVRPVGDSWDQYGGAYDVRGGGHTVLAMLGQSGSFNGLARSTDAGASWNVVEGKDAGLPPRGSSIVRPGHLVVGSNGRTAWMVLDGAVLASSDAGSTWTVVRHVRGAAATDLARQGNGTLVLLSEDGVRTSRDLGRSWTPLPGAPGAAPGSGSLTASAGPYPLLVTRWRTDSGAGLYGYDGAHWRALRDDYYAYAAVADPRDGRRLYLATNDDPYHDVVGSSGVWTSADAGRSWQRMAGLPYARVTSLVVDAVRQRLIVGTNGEGAWQYPI